MRSKHLAKLKLEERGRCGLKILKWLIPVLFVLFGIFLQNFIHGHSFLGMICFGIAGLISVYYLIGMLKRDHFMTAKVLRTVVTSLVLLGILLVGSTLAVIYRASLGDTQTQCQYIVVLGAKVNGTSPSLSLSDRIRTAEAYLKAHPGTVAVLSGGQGADEGISEAQCMYDQLTQRGIAADRLWLEEQATSTWENLQYTLDLIEVKTGDRPQTLGIVSSEYHLFRAGMFARECGVEAVGIPAPTAWVSLRLNYFLREVAGVWHYLILGGQYHD